MTKLEPTRTSSDLTATEQLRRMLDERGVEHVDEKDGKFLLVTWNHNETSATFVEDTVSGETSIAISAIVSPEQAVEATLRTGTCHADETDTWECVCDQAGRLGKRVTIHVIECSACGHTYEHINGSYEYCPRCGRRRVEVDDG